MIWVSMPSMIEAMVITVATPITTPRMVSALRSLLVRSESRAIVTPSWRWRSTGLFLTKRGNRVEPRGAGRGIDPEHDAGSRAERERHSDRPHRHPSGQGCCDRDQRREPPAG